MSTHGSPHFYKAIHVVSIPTTLTVVHPRCRMESAHIGVRRVSSLHYHRRLEHHLRYLLTEKEDYRNVLFEMLAAASILKLSLFERLPRSSKRYFRSSLARTDFEDLIGVPRLRSDSALEVDVLFTPRITFTNINIISL